MDMPEATMDTATVRLDHMMDREGPVNRWILECPHGRWFADDREGGFPPTSVLLPNHDQEHDRACTHALWDHYGRVEHGGINSSATEPGAR